MSSSRYTIVCTVHWGQDSVVGLDGPGLETRRGQEIFFPFKTSRPALSLSQPPGQWVPGFLPSVKRPGH